MAEAAALATAHLSRYDALLRVSKTLAGHKTWPSSSRFSPITSILSSRSTTWR